MIYPYFYRCKSLLHSYPDDNISTSAAIFVYSGAFDIARSVRNVSGCTLLRNVKLACNKPSIDFTQIILFTILFTSHIIMLDTHPHTVPCLQAFLTSSCLKKYTTIGFQYVLNLHLLCPQAHFITIFHFRKTKECHEEILHCHHMYISNN